MPAFIVTVEEVIRYTVEVEADDEESAGQAAKEYVADDSGNIPNQGLEERSVYMVMRK